MVGCCLRYGVLVWDEVRKMDSGDGCIIRSIYLMLCNYIFENG